MKDEQIWQVCEYMRSEPCQHCRHGEEQTGYGPATRGCYLLAEEMIRKVSQILADENGL